MGADAWRPSVSLDYVAYWDDGVKVCNLASGETEDIDSQGDLPTAAPAYVAYFRPVEGESATSWEIVTHGLTTGYEQVLAEQDDPPWLSPAIAACGLCVAFVAAGELHVFEWQATEGEQ